MRARSSRLSFSCRVWARRWRASAACDQAVWAEDVSLDAEGRPRFTLCARDAADHDDGALFATVERVPCALSLTGAHNVDNACAAASVGIA